MHIVGFFGQMKIGLLKLGLLGGHRLNPYTPLGHNNQ
jgi:hypothetical protein